MPSPKNRDLTGQKFGRWKCLSKSRHETKSLWMWDCECECGKMGTVPEVALLNGSTKSCGCGHTLSLIKHGMRETPEYSSWISMKKRCFSKSHQAYHKYGGAGITVCERWKGSFINFYLDLGPRGSLNFSLDRIDNTNGYSCGSCEECLSQGWTMNCRWATKVEQANNRSNSRKITFGGETKTIGEWSKARGIKSTTLHRRINAGWSVERALSE